MSRRNITCQKFKATVESRQRLIIRCMLPHRLAINTSGNRMEAEDTMLPNFSQQLEHLPCLRTQGWLTDARVAYGCKGGLRMQGWLTDARVAYGCKGGLRMQGWLTDARVAYGCKGGLRTQGWLGGSMKGGLPLLTPVIACTEQGTKYFIILSRYAMHVRRGERNTIISFLQNSVAQKLKKWRWGRHLHRSDEGWNFDA